jgi:formate hydrogenlyase subunit 3/multisubunit Na+/H+ antiporter MnhD subunit
MAIHKNARRMAGIFFAISIYWREGSAGLEERFPFSSFLFSAVACSYGVISPLSGKQTKWYITTRRNAF